MALSKDDVLNAIAEMSVMDIVELISAMEEKFGVLLLLPLLHLLLPVLLLLLKSNQSLTLFLPALARRKLA